MTSTGFDDYGRYIIYNNDGTVELMDDYLKGQTKKYPSIEDIPGFKIKTMHAFLIFELVGLLLGILLLCVCG